MPSQKPTRKAPTVDISRIFAASRNLQVGTGTCVAACEGMYVSLDREQAEVLREILQNTLKQVRIESARTDAHDFREMLHHREDVLESLLVKLSEESHAQIS